MAGPRLHRILSRHGAAFSSHCTISAAVIAWTAACLSLCSGVGDFPPRSRCGSWIAGPCNAGPLTSELEFGLQVLELRRKIKLELKEMLSARGLSISGKKADLVQRLHAADVCTGDDRTGSLEVTSTEQEIGFAVGMEVEVEWGSHWYLATILELSADGKTCTARYHETGDEETSINVGKRLRKVMQPWLKQGMKVETNHEETWYLCKVLWVSNDGKMCTIKYNEGGAVEKDVNVATRVRATDRTEKDHLASRISWKCLQVGQKLRGTVIDIRAFGIFVDVGTERDGLVHRSRVSGRYADNLQDLVAIGDDVDVWVSRISGDHKLELSMVEHKFRTARDRITRDVSDFVGLPPAEWLAGTVRGFTSYGIFVDVSPPGGKGLAQKGVVHVTEISDEYVECPSKAGYKDGQEISVRVLRADTKSGRLDLSLKEPKP